MTPVPQLNYRACVNHKGVWKEIFNSDEEQYGGSGITNSMEITAEDIQWNGLDQSIELKLPPLACVILKREK